MESERQILYRLNDLIIKTSETLKLWQLMLEHQPNDVISHLKENLRLNLITWPFNALVENKDNVNLVILKGFYFFRFVLNLLHV